MKYLFILISAIPAYANLNNLAKEYLGISNELKSAKYGLEIQQELYELELDKRPFVFTLNSQKQNSKYRSNTSSTETDSLVHTFSLGKEFIWGGELSLSKSLYEYETTNTIDSESQSFTYSQNLGKNFFGINNFRNKEIKSLEVNFQKQYYESLKSKSLLDFLVKYVNVKKELTQYELQKQALQRAESRNNLIKKQVKDGLKERVDLYSSLTGLTYQQEQVEQKKSQLYVAKSVFESKLERDVKLDAFSEYKIKKSNSSKVHDEKLTNNYDIQAAQSKLLYLEEALKNAKNNVIPSVVVSASLNKNNFNNGVSINTSSVSIAETDEKVFGISLTLPLGFDVEQNAKRQANITKMKAEYDLKSVKLNTQKSVEQIKIRILSLEKNIERALERYDLARKTVKEYSSLYNKGRANLDQVLRAEEELIQTEQAFVQYISQKEVEQYALYDIYGVLEQKVIK